MKLTKWILIAVCVATAAALGACHSNKNTAASASSSRPAKVKALRSESVESLGATYTPWNSFYAPFSLKLSKPMSLSVSGRATMEKDKYIHLSLRMLGMEVAVVYIDADSAHLADKFHRYKVSVPFSAISARTSLTLADLQSLLLGQAFYPGKGTLQGIPDEDTLFSVTKSGDDAVWTPRRTPAGATWYFTVAPGPVLSSLSVEPDGLGQFEVLFSNIFDCAAGNVAGQISGTGTVGNKNFDGRIIWTSSKVEIDANKTASCPSFNGYRTLSLQELIAALKGMI